LVAILRSERVKLTKEDLKLYKSDRIGFSLKLKLLDFVEFDIGTQKEGREDV
jgi:hypothetical protein